MTPPRAWFWLLALLFSAENLIEYLRADQFELRWSALFAAADSIDAMMGAAIARRFILAAVQEVAVNLELRILAFQIIRELLQNVAKHAGVQSAQVIVDQIKRELRIEVMDSGVGFEWQYDLFLDQSRGFGLFSISDRIHSACGQFSVDTAPGKGCRVTLSLINVCGKHADRIPSQADSGPFAQTSGQ